MESFRFEHIEWLNGLYLVPLIALGYILINLRQKKLLRSYGDLDLVMRLMPNASPFRRNLKFSLKMLALICLIFALARPQFGSKLQEVKRKGVELIIALDVSNSMMAEDIQPNRLDRAKQSISKLLDKLSNDRVGLIVFAGDAYTQLPITTDYASAKMFLSTINTNVVPKQGTAIGSAIKLATKSFSQDESINKAIIVITDGENHEDDAAQAAQTASEKGIVIHTLGMGLTKGGPIPVSSNSINKTYRKDKSGNVVISKLDEVMLQNIAVAGGGAYIRASNSNIGLKTLFEEIESMEKVEFESKIYTDYDDQFPTLVWSAFILLLLDWLLLERKNKYLKNIQLFQ